MLPSPSAEAEAYADAEAPPPPGARAARRISPYISPVSPQVLGLDQDFFCAAAKAGLVTGHQVASGAAEDLLAKLCAVCPSVCDARDELVPEGPSP